MPRKGYTTAQKLEAIALGRVMGAESAGKQLHIDPRSIIKWTRDAGHPPVVAGTQQQWKEQFDLAHARLMERLTSPKVTVAELATAKGIAERNLRGTAELPPESAVDALDAFIDWVFDVGHVTSEDAFGVLKRELIIRANAEPDQPHRQATLAWFSGRPEIPAGDALPWAQDQTRALLAEHHSLAGLREWRSRRDAEQDAADLVVRELARVASLWAAQGFPAAECWARAAGGPPGLDAKALELLDQA